jgi:perosamine synthetase
VEAYERLEAEWGRWAGYPAGNVVACASGSAAVLLALQGLRLPPGAEVVTGDFNMIAVPRAVSLAGLVPVFVDCDEDLLMNEEMAMKSYPYQGPARAVLFTHVYGRRCRMDRIARAAVHNCSPACLLIEDLSEAHGVKPHPSADAAAWSCYRNKVIAGSEGGVVAFKDPATAALARRLRCLGFEDGHDFRHTPGGWNHRLSNEHAAPIIDSLRQSPWNLQQRRRIEGWYEAHCPPEWRMPPRDSVWIYDVRVPGLTRERQGVVVRALNAAGVAARHSFLPMHLQEEYRGCRRVGGEVAERMSREVFYLPCAPGQVTEESAARAFDVIRRALAPENL